MVKASLGLIFFIFSNMMTSRGSVLCTLVLFKATLADNLACMTDMKVSAMLTIKVNVTADLSLDASRF